MNILLVQRGVHFFRPVPKEYLHSAELRDIMQVCHCFPLTCYLIKKLSNAVLLIPCSPKRLKP